MCGHEQCIQGIEGLSEKTEHSHYDNNVDVVMEI